MTVTGSGDAARELLALDEAEDVAPPDIRNGTQERLGAGEGTGSGAASRRVRESRRHLDACEGIGDVKPGKCNACTCVGFGMPRFDHRRLDQQLKISSVSRPAILTRYKFGNTVTCFILASV